MFVDYKSEPDMVPSFKHLYQGRPAVIPCRTSNPKYRVEFTCLCMNPQPLGPADGVLYDPKVGVTILNPDKEVDGLFQCMVMTDDGMVHSRIFVFVIICKYMHSNPL